ncbi:MAG: helix-turn-helix domain-containing protein [Christensenellales bacterium]|jgi:transcriptional regulator with XRE-family HTH domain
MFSERLRALREEAGLSQQYLAEKLGVERTRYGKWEKGVEPSYEVLNKIADFFQVSTDYLLGRTENRHAYIAKMPPDMEGVKVVKYGSDQLTPEEVAALRRFLAEQKLD